MSLSQQQHQSPPPPDSYDGDENDDLISSCGSCDSQFTIDTSALLNPDRFKGMYDQADEASFYDTYELLDWLLEGGRYAQYAPPTSTPPARVVTNHPNFTFNTTVVSEMDRRNFTGLTHACDLGIVRLYNWAYDKNSAVGSAGTSLRGNLPLLFIPLFNNHNRSFGITLRDLLALRHVAGVPISLNSTIADMGDIHSSVNHECFFEEYEFGEYEEELVEALRIDSVREPIGDDEDDPEWDYSKGWAAINGRIERVYDGTTPTPPSKRLTAMHVAVLQGGTDADEDQSEIAIEALAEAYIVDIIAGRAEEANPMIEFPSPNMQFCDDRYYEM